jgi:hypothetical protein
LFGRRCHGSSVARAAGCCISERRKDGAERHLSQIKAGSDGFCTLMSRIERCLQRPAGSFGVANWRRARTASAAARLPGRPEFPLPNMATNFVSSNVRSEHRSLSTISIRVRRRNGRC